MKKKITKKSVIVVGVVFGLLLLITGAYFGYTKYMDWQETTTRKKIEESYHDTVVVKEDSKLYQKVNENYQEAGMVQKGVKLSLKQNDILSSKDHYFGIKDTEYYISYDKVEESEIQTKKDIYVPFHEEVVTKENTTLEMEEGTITFSSSMRFPVMRKTSDSYQVKFQEKWAKVAKENIERTEQIEKEEEPVASKVSVLHYKKIEENELLKQINFIKEQGFETISLEDYTDFLHGNIQLKDKVVFLSFDEMTESEKNLLDNAQITYVNTSDINTKWVDKNEASTTSKNYYAYLITGTIEDAKMKQILNKETLYTPPAPSNYATSVPVLNYHFFYDGTNGNNCGESICLDSRKFEEQLKYLKENGYKTLTMEEYRAWIYGEIELPKKSVLLTIDDGAMGTGKTNGNQLIPLLEKYDLHATLFLITAWWPKENYLSPNLDIESHGYDIHISATCNGSSKARALCMSKEELVQDLTESVRLLGTKTAFCYPFYASNETVRQATKEAGFALGFGGGNVKSTRQSNKYLIPRYPIYDSITMAQFKNMIGA